MTLRRASFSAAIAVALVPTAIGACGKSAEEKRIEADKLTAEAEEISRETTLTGATLEGTDEESEKARKATDEALRARAEAVAALRSEQIDYRGKLQRALDTLDKTLGRTRRDQARGKISVEHVKVLEARRDVLKEHLDALDRTTDQDWAALKAKIDRDLRDEERSHDREGR